jgi:tetratricopeptide (TPR) repeat protein
LAEALMTDEDLEVPAPSGKVSSDELQAYIGFRYILLAPTFDIGLEELRIHDNGEATLDVTIDDERLELSLEELREEIKERVRVEAERVRDRPSSPFAIDLNIVPTARAAVSTPERVTELLGAWPGPLSLLLRTAEGQSLAPDVRATLAEALGLLGSAYVDLGRHEWAQEVLRLAIQWGQDQLEIAADLFRRLGGAYVAQSRHGEAIGILRRALALGAPRADVLPLLAECFLQRDRRLSALLCAEDALAAGASADKVKHVRERALELFGEDWKRFRRKVPSSSATR